MLFDAAFNVLFQQFVTQSQHSLSIFFERGRIWKRLLRILFRNMVNFLLTWNAWNSWRSQITLWTNISW